MTPTVGTKRVTTTVFDLTSFDDVKLVKDVPIPAKPTTLEEATAACGNDLQKLLDVIHEGLVADAMDSAKANMEGFLTVDEEGKPGEPYTGRFADEEKGKLINGVILAMAKANGFTKDLAIEKKRQLKENATKFVRDNPAIIAGIAG